MVVVLTRQSTDVEVSAAFKKVARKAHPDKGGAPEHQKALNAARNTWQDALRDRKNPGGDRRTNGAQHKSATAPLTVKRERKESTGFRVRGVGVLLTYQKFPEAGCWQTFMDHVAARLVLWKVKFWCATTETNDDGT